jgi:hypothetical protein
LREVEVWATLEGAKAAARVAAMISFMFDLLFFDFVRKEKTERIQTKKGYIQKWCQWEDQVVYIEHCGNLKSYITNIAMTFKNPL